ncbi:MAG: foldase protein PrsA [Actinomycetota bacterium]|nr:foldase protein PrsA [Actinomycetota bacterium]
MKKPLLLVASLALAAVLGGTLASCGSVRPYAARVSLDGHTTVVATAALDAELNAIRHNTEYFKAIKDSAAQQGGAIEGTGSNTFDASFVAQILNRRVLVALVKGALTENHLQITEGDRTASKTSLKQQFTGTDSNGNPKKTSLFDKFDPSYQNDLVESNAAVTVLRDWLSNRATAASVRQYYDQHAKEFSETCIRQILVKDKAAADAARARVTSGEDFGAVADAVSTDASKAKGGDLGCLTATEEDSLDPPFRAAADALAVGQISPLVQSQFGFHIINITQRRARAFDETVQQQIAGTLSDISTFVRDLVARAKVSVNPRYGSFDKKNFAGVVPPKAPATSTSAPTAGSPFAPGQSPIQGSPTG